MLVQILSEKSGDSYLNIPHGVVCRIDIKELEIFVTPILGGTVKPLRYCVAKGTSPLDTRLKGLSLLQACVSNAPVWTPKDEEENRNDECDDDGLGEGTCEDEGADPQIEV